MGKKVFRTKSGKRVVHGVTSNGYSNHGCRCAKCTEAWRVYVMGLNRRKGVRPIKEVNAERRAAVVHGSGTVVRLGCSCEECRRFSRQERAKLRRQQASRPTPAHVHGTTNGYQNWSCRCVRCAEAAAEYQRARRLKQSSRSVKP